MKIAVGLLAVLLAVGCQHPGGKILGDTMSYDKDKKTWSPLVDYRAPDIDELTGIDSEPDEPEEPAEPAPPEAAVTPPPVATPVATPATPTKPTTPTTKSTPVKK